MAATLKSIASECHVSISTVSQILNGAACNYCSEETKEKVRMAAKRQGYKRNFGYELMRGMKTQTVAIQLSMPQKRTEEHLWQLQQLLADYFDHRNYKIYLGHAGDTEEQELEKINALMTRGVEHFVFLGTPSAYLDVEKKIIESNLSMVSTSTSFSRHVAIDIQSGAEKIIEFLLSKGKTESFRYVTGVKMNFNDSRGMALKKYFSQMDDKQLLKNVIREIGVSDNSPAYQEESFHAGYAFAVELLRSEPEVKMIFCNIDSVALGVAAGLNNAGKIIGKDVFIAGINNDFGTRCSPYPISSISHNWEKHASLLAEQALQTSPCEILLQPEIFIREL